MSNQQPRYEISRGEQLVNTALGKTAKIIRDKYDLRPSGSGAAMPGGPIQQLCLSFHTKYPHSKEELRSLLIKSAQEVVSYVNEHEEIQKYLKAPPFSIKNVEIVIYNHDKNGGTLRDPEISTAEISRCMLTYRTADFTDVFSFKEEQDESYEEALQILSSYQSK